MNTARRQDLPPPGGYKAINYKRIPAKSYFNGKHLSYELQTKLKLCNT